MKNSLTPKNPKIWDPILVTLLKMRPHYSQSSRENVTPSSGTSPVASYKALTPRAANNSEPSRNLSNKTFKDILQKETAVNFLRGNEFKAILPDWKKV